MRGYPPRASRCGAGVAATRYLCATARPWSPAPARRSSCSTTSWPRCGKPVTRAELEAGAASAQHRCGCGRTLRVRHADELARSIAPDARHVVGELDDDTWTRLVGLPTRERWFFVP